MNPETIKNRAPSTGLFIWLMLAGVAWTICSYKQSSPMPWQIEQAQIERQQHEKPKKPIDWIGLLQDAAKVAGAVKVIVAVR